MKTQRLILDSDLIESLIEYCQDNLILPDDFLSLAIGKKHSQPFLLKKEKIYGRNQTERMLKILAQLWTKSTEAFENAASGIGGHKRVWFSKDKNEIHESGNSNFSERIGDSSWHVSTNCPMEGMKARVEKVMLKMGFTWDYIQLIAWSIYDERGRIYRRRYIDS